MSCPSKRKRKKKNGKEIGFKEPVLQLETVNQIHLSGHELRKDVNNVPFHSGYLAPRRKRVVNTAIPFVPPSCIISENDFPILKVPPVSKAPVSNITVQVKKKRRRYINKFVPFVPQSCIIQTKPDICSSVPVRPIPEVKFYGGTMKIRKKKKFNGQQEFVPASCLIKEVNGVPVEADPLPEVSLVKPSYVEPIALDYVPNIITVTSRKRKTPARRGSAIVTSSCIIKEVTQVPFEDKPKGKLYFLVPPDTPNSPDILGPSKKRPRRKLNNTVQFVPESCIQPVPLVNNSNICHEVAGEKLLNNQIDQMDLDDNVKGNKAKYAIGIVVAIFIIATLIILNMK